MTTRTWTYDEESDDEFDGFVYDEDADDTDDEDFVAGLWTSYYGQGRKAAGATSVDALDRIARAHGVVSGFVRTFATDTVRYRVTLDRSVKTAGTDLDGKSVVVSAEPLFDPTIQEAEAHKVLTAMTVHECSHVRYGRNTAAAVTREFNRSQLAHKVSNLLDDCRIEVRFAADYPGYAHVFTPALTYIAKASIAANGGPIVPKMSDIFGLAVAATRYAAHVEWTDDAEIAAEREWWTKWAARWTRTDKVADHVAGVREGIERIVTQQQDEDQDGQPSDGQDQGEGDEQGAQGGQGQDQGEDQDQGAQGGGTPTGADLDKFDRGTDPLPTCAGDAKAIDAAAATNGAYNPVSDSQAQEYVDSGANAAHITDPVFGEVSGTVYWTARGLAKKAGVAQDYVTKQAASAIRAAFARSRTGHGSIVRGMKAGELDNHNLYRVAMSETNVCRRRVNGTPGNFRVWLMVDLSGSMAGQPIVDETKVAAALASACQYLPNVTLEVFGWTSPFAYVSSDNRFGVCRVWTKGEPISNVGYLRSLQNGGTPDSMVMGWLTKEMPRHLVGKEKGVVIFASDGQGYLTREHIDAARKAGLDVISLALGDGIDMAQQEATYGKGKFVKWAGSIAATARPLGQLLGSIASRS